MKYEVRVRANARKNFVEKDVFGIRVWTTESPERGKANDAVTRLLADYFDVSVSRIKLVRGGTSAKKIFEIQ